MELITGETIPVKPYFYFILLKKKELQVELQHQKVDNAKLFSTKSGLQE